MDNRNDNCLICGASLVGKRAGAIWCSPRCKAKGFRLAKRADKISRIFDAQAGKKANDSYILLYQINSRAGGYVDALAKLHGDGAAALGIKIFEALLEQGLVISRRAK